MSIQRHLDEITRLAQQLVQLQAEAEAYRDAWIKKAEVTARQGKASADAALHKASQEVQATFQQTSTQAERAHADARAAAQQRRDKALAAAVDAYIPQLDAAQSAQSAICNDLGLLGADWDDVRWTRWRPGQSQANGVLSLADSGVRMGRLRETGDWDALLLPALLPLIGHGSLLIKARGPARSPAAHAAQSLLLRLLAATPPAKLRFTFIDPVGLGQNAAVFMHLADYDESLVTSRAWTEPQHIEQHLAELTEHIETTPAASKLGPNRAIFVSEEEARSEKFRPYHLPSAQWLAWAHERLNGRRLQPQSPNV